jgi:hypothetical protein
LVVLQKGLFALDNLGNLFSALIIGATFVAIGFGLSAGDICSRSYRAKYMDPQDERRAKKQVIVAAILFGVDAGLIGTLIHLEQLEYSQNVLIFVGSMIFVAAVTFFITWISLWFIIILTREVIRYL